MRFLRSAIINRLFLRGRMTNAVAAKVKWVWVLAFLCAGLGCGLMGPLLPVLARQWGLADNRSGLLLGLLLAGSCGGTLTLQRRLEHAVRRGVFCAAAGMAAFALCTRSNSPSIYAAALLVVSITGFGLGSLMSAVNLLAGRLPVQQRTGVLAQLGAVWCVGAMLSPAFATPRFLGWSWLFACCCWQHFFLFVCWIATHGAGKRMNSAMDEVVRGARPVATYHVRVCRCNVPVRWSGRAASVGWLPRLPTAMAGARWERRSGLRQRLWFWPDPFAHDDPAETDPGSP